MNVFDGRPPTLGWESRNLPVNDFACSQVISRTPSPIIATIMQKSTHGEPYLLSPYQRSRIDHIAVNAFGDIDYNVHGLDVADLGLRLAVIRAPASREMLASYEAVPERCMPVATTVLSD